MRLLRRRLLDVSLTGAIAVIVSLYPFVTVSKNQEVLQPPQVRVAFLACVIISWPLFLLCIVPSLYTYYHLQKSEAEGRYITSSNSAALHVVILATTMGFFASSCLVVAQAFWVWTASRVGIVWLLSTAVLGIAVLLVYAASILSVCVTAVRIWSTTGESDANPTITPLKPRPRPREVTILQIDKDIYSPQKVVATIPKPGSELAF